ncbi:MAG: type II CAAX endopeptidase family protein [Candidatus Marinimicrobia bacterium]|nr:type II CAAX endopeptidase family protein [Candidatus Neomarinimicrobiota bacterium]
MPEIIPKTKTAVFLLIFSVIFGMTAAILITTVAALENYIDDATYLGLLVGEGLMLLPVAKFCKRLGSSYHTFFRMKSVSLKSLVAILPVGLGMVIIMDELDRLVQMFFPIPEIFEQINRIMTIDSIPSAIVIIGFIVILGPLFEEMLFRGFFQRILEYRLNDVTKAALYSALTFALVHSNPWGIVQIYIIGVFLGYIAWRTGSIWISLFLHMINNGFAVLFSNLPDGALSWYEFYGHTHPALIVVAIVIFYLGMKWFIAVTPVTERDENIVFIENIHDASAFKS